MELFPINLPKIEPFLPSLYREERAMYEAELQRLKAARLPWWRRLARGLRPKAKEAVKAEHMKTAPGETPEGRSNLSLGCEPKCGAT